MAASIEEMLKTGLIRMGNDPKLEVHHMPLNIPHFDNMMGGGIPKGKFIQAYGPESTGKTLLAQIITAVVQQQPENNMALYVDLENSFDKDWWDESGVDTSKLMVTVPETAEDAEAVILALLDTMPELGIVIVDSIAALTVSDEMQEKAEGQGEAWGLQARFLGKLYRKIKSRNKNGVIFYFINQMRDTIGNNDELSALPGGRAQRHYSHVILRTKRDSWITDSNGQRIGYYMEVTPRKNKTAPMAPGVTLPILFRGQLDLLTSYLEQAIAAKYITRRGPYFYIGDDKTGHLGIPKLRNYFQEHSEALDELKEKLGVQ